MGQALAPVLAPVLTPLLDKVLPKEVMQILDYAKLLMLPGNELALALLTKVLQQYVLPPEVAQTLQIGQQTLQSLQQLLPQQLPCKPPATAPVHPLSLGTTSGLSAALTKPDLLVDHTQSMNEWTSKMETHWKDLVMAVTKDSPMTDIATRWKDFSASVMEGPSSIGEGFREAANGVRVMSLGYLDSTVAAAHRSIDTRQIDSALKARLHRMVDQKYMDARESIAVFATKGILIATELESAVGALDVVPADVFTNMQAAVERAWRAQPTMVLLATESGVSGIWDVALMPSIPESSRASVLASNPVLQKEEWQQAMQDVKNALRKQALQFGEYSWLGYNPERITLLNEERELTKLGEERGFIKSWAQNIRDYFAPRGYDGYRGESGVEIIDGPLKASIAEIEQKMSDSLKKWKSSTAQWELEIDKKVQSITDPAQRREAQLNAERIKASLESARARSSGMIRAAETRLKENIEGYAELAGAGGVLLSDVYDRGFAGAYEEYVTWAKLADVGMATAEAAWNNIKDLTWNIGGTVWSALDLSVESEQYWYNLTYHTSSVATAIPKAAADTSKKFLKAAVKDSIVPSPQQVLPIFVNRTLKNATVDMPETIKVAHDIFQGGRTSPIPGYVEVFRFDALEVFPENLVANTFTEVWFPINDSGQVIVVSNMSEINSPDFLRDALKRIVHVSKDNFVILVTPQKWDTVSIE